MNAIFLLKNKSDIAFLLEDHTVRQGLEKMKAHGYTALPVLTHDGEYVGSISEGDFLWHIISTDNNDLRSKEDNMLIDLIRPHFNPAVRIDVTMEYLLNRAKEQNFVPVVDDRNKFIGIITRKDIIAYFQSRYAKEPISPKNSSFEKKKEMLNI